MNCYTVEDFESIKMNIHVSNKTLIQMCLDNQSDSFILFLGQVHKLFNLRTDCHLKVAQH